MGRKKLNLSEEERVLRRKYQMKKVYEKQKLAKKRLKVNLTAEQLEKKRSRERVENMTKEQVERKRKRQAESKKRKLKLAVYEGGQNVENLENGVRAERASRVESELNEQTASRLAQLRKNHLLAKSESRPVNEEWKRWCRLCAKANAQYINVLSGQYMRYTSFNDSYSAVNLLAVIEEFFQVQIKEDEKLSPFVCTECYNIVISFIKFKDSVKKVQQLYDDLRHGDDKTKVNLPTLYEKIDLTEEETFSPEINAALPQEDVFIADSIVIKSERVSEEFFTEEFIKGVKKKDNFQKQDSSDDNEKEEHKDNFTKHEYMETEVSPEISKESIKYACRLCLKSFQNSGHYFVHMRKKHKEFACTQCTKSFDSESCLKVHMKNHQELFPCPHCDRKFQINRCVARHIKFMNADERPFIWRT